MATSFDIHLIPPYAQLESTNIIKKFIVKSALKCGEKGETWCSIIALVGISLSSLFFHSPLENSRIRPFLFPVGCVLTSLALTILYGIEVIKRLDKNWHKLDALNKKGKHSKALELARYEYAFTKAMGLPVVGFESGINIASEALLSKGRRLYIFKSSGELSRKNSLLENMFNLGFKQNLQQAKEALSQKPPIHKAFAVVSGQLGFAATTYPSFQGYNGVVIHNLPEHMDELLNYVADLKNKGLQFDTLYTISSTSRVADIQQRALPTSLMGIQREILKKEDLNVLRGKFLFVAGAPFVPQADVLVRQLNPDLKFETVGPYLPNASLETYSSEIQGYIKNRPLHKEKT